MPAKSCRSRSPASSSYNPCDLVALVVDEAMLQEGAEKVARAKRRRG